MNVTNNVQLNMKKMFNATIDGYELSIMEMSEIANYFRACQFGEYLEDNYEITTEDAINYGYEVGRIMDKYDYNEETAIDTVARKFKLTYKEN